MQILINTNEMQVLCCTLLPLVYRKQVWIWAWRIHDQLDCNNKCLTRIYHETYNKNTSPSLIHYYPKQIQNKVLKFKTNVIRNACKPIFIFILHLATSAISIGTKWSEGTHIFLCSAWYFDTTHPQYLSCIMLWIIIN